MKKRVARKQYTRKVTLNTEVILPKQIPNGNMGRVMCVLEIAPHLTRMAKTVNMPIATVHDNIKRIVRDYDVKVIVEVKEKKR